MSTIISANVSDGTLSIPTTFVTNGSAKAWVNFNGTGTVAIRDSLNVASLTDNGTGDYTVNFSSAFGAGNYAATTSQGRGTSGTDNLSIIGPITNDPSASAFRVVTINFGGSNTDAGYVYLLAHGDLA
jgi:hypothetical protein